MRAESDHAQATVHALVGRLSAIPGLDLRVFYGQGRLRRLLGDLPYLNELHRRADPIRRLEVSAAGTCYWLRCEPGAIHCGRELAPAHRAPVHEELPFASWAAELFAEISRQSHASQDAMSALRALVEHDQLN